MVSDTENQSGTVCESQYVHDQLNPSGALGANAPSEIDSLTISPPQWTISKTTIKSGRTNVTNAVRKEEENAALKQTTRVVNAVAGGTVPSVTVLLEAIASGATYRKYAIGFRALSIVQQKKRANLRFSNANASILHLLRK